MAETYCGKNCLECEEKEALSCPGCLASSGRPYYGDCTLARCVREKGHETCGTCSFQSSCGKLLRRDQMPQERQKKKEAEEQRKLWLAQKAATLGKWLWILFWLVIPSTVVSFLTNESIVAAVPGLLWPGVILNAAISAAYGVILLKLAPVHDRYKTAGVCTLVSCAIALAVKLISGTGEAAFWTVLFTIPSGIVALVGVYQEFYAHADVLSGVDDELSQKWEKLWKWRLILIAVIFGSLLLAFLAPGLVALIMLASAIGVAVVGILQLVYLYRTAQIFRTYG